MKYKSLTYRDKKFNKKSIIEDILLKHDFNWLINAEFENAILELKNDTIIWKNGTWYYGIWEFGIWQDGVWHDGHFINGIFEKGDKRNGKFENVIDIDGKRVT